MAVDLPWFFVLLAGALGAIPVSDVRLAFALLLVAGILGVLGV